MRILNIFMSPDEAAQVLGCSASATIEEISRLFRRAALKCHPDRAGGTEEEFVRINKAYETLTGKGKEEKDSITEDIYVQFKKMYEGSEEEKEEIIFLYKKYKGILSRIIDHMMLGEDEQEKRYRAIIDPLIESKKLLAYPQYKKSPLANRKRQEKRKKEAEQAALLAEEIKKREGRRQEAWDSLINRLESKVSSSKKKRNK